MLSFHAILFFVAIHLAGPDVTSVEVTTPMKEVLVIRRGDEGVWTMTEKPDFDRGALTIDGQVLTHTSKKGEKRFDMAELIGTSGETDWAAVRKLEWGKNEVVIERPEPRRATITFRFAPPDHAAEKPLTFKVGW